MPRGTTRLLKSPKHSSQRASFCFLAACSSACDGPDCMAADYDGDGVKGTDADIAAFFAALAGA